MITLVRLGAGDPVLASLRPRLIEPEYGSHMALWRQAWAAWQEVRGFDADLITPPDHYRPNPYWGPPQIRLWTYNRAALLLTRELIDVGESAGPPPTSAVSNDSAQAERLLRFLGVR